MRWALYRRHLDDGSFVSMSIDEELLDAAPVADLPLGCRVTISASSAAPNALASTEDAAERAVAQLGGRIVSTARQAEQLVILTYLPVDADPQPLAQLPLPPSAEITVEPARDPDWTMFDPCRPVDMEVQSLADMAAFRELFAAGDRGGIRPIDHAIVGLPTDRSDSFFDAVRSVVGPVEINAVEPEPDVAATPGAWTLSHQGDPSDITQDSWTIRLIAERHGATYDGWGCATLTGEPPSRARRRWGRRR